MEEFRRSRNRRRRWAGNERGAANGNGIGAANGICAGFSAGNCARIAGAGNLFVGGVAFSNFCLASILVLSILGEVIVGAPGLDRDGPYGQERYSLVVEARLGEDAAQQGIQLLLDDANDNAPQFGERVYEAGVAEDVAIGSEIARVTATDVDAGMNAQVVYSIVEITSKKPGIDVSGTFGIDDETGVIRSLVPLDREEVDEYEVQLMATDKGKPHTRSASTTIVVRILDRNDYAPMFPLRNFDFHVSEDTPANSVIGSVKALDFDSEPYAQTSYKLEPSTLPFFVDHDGNVGIKKQLDRETRTKYHLRVYSHDKERPSLKDKATISIEVSDINDNAPTFLEGTHYKVRPSDNVANYTVARVTVEDRDTALVNGGDISAEILAGDDDDDDAGKFFDFRFKPDVFDGAVRGTGVLSLRRRARAPRDYTVDVRLCDGRSICKTQSLLVSVQAKGGRGLFDGPSEGKMKDYERNGRILDSRSFLAFWKSKFPRLDMFLILLGCGLLIFLLLVTICGITLQKRCLFKEKSPTQSKSTSSSSANGSAPRAEVKFKPANHNASNGTDAKFQSANHPAPLPPNGAGSRIGTLNKGTSISDILDEVGALPPEPARGTPPMTTFGGVNAPGSFSAAGHPYGAVNGNGYGVAGVVGNGTLNPLYHVTNGGLIPSPRGTPVRTKATPEPETRPHYEETSSALSRCGDKETFIGSNDSLDTKEQSREVYFASTLMRHGTLSRNADDIDGYKRYSACDSDII